ncbi:alpha/beta hydrolase [Ramlibacter sp. AN1015]|uniref:alpha/beta fold hydrolase n=1 Tax=Ramlibacter sp. AN1015 TaxID=3133428 RepID=UPI0030BA3BDB
MRGALPPRRLVSTAAGVVECIVSGQGRPVWVLFAGAGISLEGWRGLYPDIEQLGTVLAWNRLGLGRSTRPRVPQSSNAVVATLREVLARCELVPPYVLVGHSLGGLHAMLFARRHPSEVAGVLLLEASHPADRDHGRGQESRLATALDRLFPLPKAWFRANLHAELQAQEQSARELEAAGAFPPVPLIVMSGALPPPPWLADAQAVQRRREHQRLLAQLSPQGEQIVALESGHFPQRSEPALVLGAMRTLAVRLGADEQPPPAGLRQALNPL